jgi:murein DD-endopeptidase MepM/ murein hydrolase activator NlpD
VDYGTRRRALALDSRKRHRRWRVRRRVAVLGLAVAATIAGAVWLLLSLGGESTQSTAASRPSDIRAVATVATAHPRQHIGALAEGSVQLPSTPVTPPSSELVANGGMRFAQPVATFAQIDDWFGTPRQYGTVHSGVDFGLEGMGQVPVLAACDGKVIESTSDERYGPHVTIDCGSGWTVVEAYLAQVGPTVGETVARGVVIGASDPVDEFVHFEIDWNGTPVDPAGYVKLPPRPRPPETPTPHPVVVGPSRGGFVSGTDGSSVPDSTPPPEPTANAAPATAGTSPAAKATSTPIPTSIATPRPTATPTPKAARPTPTRPSVAQ